MENSNSQPPINQLKTLGLYYEHRVAESLKSKLAKLYLWIRRTKANGIINTRRVIENGISAEQAKPPKYIMSKYDVTSWEVEGREIFKIAPKQNKTTKHVLHLHGGSYINNFSSYHWSYFDALITETGCTVIAPDYPLAPAHTYLDSFRFIEPVYKKLISEVGSNDLILMGDSAGGGFALGLAQKLKQDGVPQPAHIILIAPWLDVTCSNPETPAFEKDDAMVSLEAAIMAGKSYSRGGDINSYMVSPINGSMEGLGKISVFVSSNELVWPDVKKLRLKCHQQGVPVDFYVYPKMIHVWVVAGLAESSSAIQQIKGIIA